MSFYNRLKTKFKNEAREATYFNFLLGSISNMFQWNEIPCDQRFLEEYLHCDRYFGCQQNDKLPEGFAFAPAPARNGKLDQFGQGTHASGATMGGAAEINGEIGKDVLICYNNTARCMDFDVMQYAYYLAEVDKALVVNTRLSALAPLLSGVDTKTVAAIENEMDKLLNGEVKVVTSDNVIRALAAGNEQGLFSVDITNPERIRYTQYLSSLWDNLLRRFFNKYGLNIQNVNKMAQASEDEVHGLDCVSWNLPIDMLKARQKFCEDANALWGTNWSVDFADPWKQEYEAYMRRMAMNDMENELEAQEEAEIGSDSPIAEEGSEPDEEENKAEKA